MREDIIESEHYKAEIHVDHYTENPREFYEHLGTLYVTSKYSHAAEGCIHSAEELEALEKRKDIIWLPVYAYIHSGIAVNTTGFSCPWDSGRLGIIFVTKEDARKNLGWKRLTKARTEKIEQFLKDEIEEWGAYLNGDVYGVRIIEKGAEEQEDEIVDMTWGFYGYKYARESAEEELERREKVWERQ